MHVGEGRAADVPEVAEVAILAEKVLQRKEFQTYLQHSVLMSQKSLKLLTSLTTTDKAMS